MLTTKICRLCQASFVPDNKEDYCPQCIKPIPQITNQYKRTEKLLKKYEKGGKTK